MMVHVSLDKAHMNEINVSTPDFCIWQHFSSNRTVIHLWKLVDVTEILVAQLYKHMTDKDRPTLLFNIKKDMKEGSSFTEKLLVHPGTYIRTISMFFIACVMWVHQIY